MPRVIKEKAQQFLSFMQQQQVVLAKKEMGYDKESPQGARQAFELMNDYLNLISYPLAAYNLYHEYQCLLPDSLFASMRSLWVKMLSYGETALSPYLDISFSDIEERLGVLGEISSKDHLVFLQKSMLLVNYSLEFSAMHSKMSFVWVDLMTRLVTLMKNFVCYSKIYPALALDHPEHETYTAIVSLVTLCLNTAAEKLKQRYELKSQLGDDLERALIYLGVLKQIWNLCANSNESLKTQRKYDVWKAKLNADRHKARNS